MALTSAIALSGMNAAQAGLQASAHNIANLDTAGFRRQRVEQSSVSGGGVATTLSQESMQESTSGSPEIADVVGLLQARNAFLANLAVFRTSDRMTGALLDRAA